MPVSSTVQQRSTYCTTDHTICVRLISLFEGTDDFRHNSKKGEAIVIYDTYQEDEILIDLNAGNILHSYLMVSSI